MTGAGNLVLQGLVVGRGGRTAAGPLDGRLRGPGLNLLLGRAGSGKTTLLMTIAGFLPPLSGMVAGEERPAESAPGEVSGGPWNPTGRICLAFQNPETLFFLPTVGEEVVCALLARGAGADVAAALGREWLARWGLPPDTFWTRNPLALSGGEKRRVALAACTVFRPPVILLDEPLAGLDREGQETMLGLLAGLAEESLVLVVTHDPEPLLPRSGTVLLLDGGAGRWFETSGGFLAAALAEPGLFPLPGWYRTALAGTKASGPPPWPEADAVDRFLRERPPATLR